MRQQANRSCSFFGSFSRCCWIFGGEKHIHTHTRGCSKRCRLPALYGTVNRVPYWFWRAVCHSVAVFAACCRFRAWPMAGNASAATDVIKILPSVLIGSLVETVLRLASADLQTCVYNFPSSFLVTVFFSVHPCCLPSIETTKRR